MKKKLADIRRLLAAFKELCIKFPKCQNYRNTVDQIAQQEVNLVSTIGRNTTHH